MLIFALYPVVMHAGAQTSGTFLGWMDLDGYCKSQSEGGAVLANQTWECSGNTQPINLNNACVWQYSIATATAQETRTNDPYSYGCFTQTVTPTPTVTLTPTPTPQVASGQIRLGGMDLDSYCQSAALGSATLNNQTWVCTGNNQAINLTNACIWQYGRNDAFASQDTPGNPYTWSCYIPLTVTPTLTATPSVTPTLTPTEHDDWATYLYNSNRTSNNTQETILSAGNAANVIQQWVLNPASANAAISVQPAVVGNTIYWGSWDGMMHASDLKGNLVWQTYIGVDTPPAANNCNPPSVGVASSASVRTISVNNVLTPIVYVGGGDGYLYALYASSGKLLWKTKLADLTTGGFLWSSPAEYSGSVYIGVGSLGDCPLTQGLLYQVNWRTGAVQHMAKLVPDGCVGAGAWTSPTIDTQNNKIYITTGTQDNSCMVNGQAYVEANALAIVEFDLSLNILGSWRIPASEQGIDSDFGVSPALTSAVVNGVKTQLVSAANKNGIFYLFKRDAISQGPLWEKTLGAGGTCPDCGDGTISSSATNGTVLYQGSGRTTINGTNYLASIRAIDPKTGNFLWEHGLVHALVASPTLVNGFLIVPNGNYIELINAANGQEIKHITPPGANSIFDAPAAVSQGMFFIGNLNGTLYEFGL